MRAAVQPLFADVKLDRHGPITDLLEALAENSATPFLKTRDLEVNVSEFADLAKARAQVLHGFGLGHGDRVALVCDNDIDRVAWMFGIWWIGAVEVSVNYELHGPLLKHVLEDSRPKHIVCHSKFVDAVKAEVDTPLLVLDEVDVPPVTEDFSTVLDERNMQFRGSDMATILYTSGTTGPAKGVMLPRAYFSNIGAIWASNSAMKAGDVGYFPLPFFHVDGHVLLSACLQTRSTLSFRQRFSLSEYWDDIAHFQATWAVGVGSMLSMLAETTPGDRKNSLTRVMGAPIPETAYKFFEEELGIPILTLYGQTECDAVTLDTMDRRRRGACGSVHELIDLRVVDAEDRELPAGEIGQIIYRPMFPNLTALGYWDRPEYTLEAWRNLWFHSGDTGFVDEDGFLHFVGRQTDSFRRRGENISAWELESTLTAAPGVRECIAIAVPDEHGGEDEIKIFVVPSEEEPFDAATFMKYCQENLPRYAVPQWMTVASGDEFVRSPGTGVVQKHLLSKEVGEPHAVKIER